MPKRFRFQTLKPTGKSNPTQKQNKQKYPDKRQQKTPSKGGFNIDDLHQSTSSLTEDMYEEEEEESYIWYDNSKKSEMTAKVASFN